MTTELCPVCGGEKTDGSTSFTVDFSKGIVVVRDVPAAVCNQCGEEWISDETAKKLEEITTQAKKQNQEIFMVKYGSYPIAS